MATTAATAAAAIRIGGRTATATALAAAAAVTVTAATPGRAAAQQISVAVDAAARYVSAPRAAVGGAPLLGALLLRADAARFALSAAGETWTLGGPRGPGGRVDALASTRAVGGFRAFLAASADRPSAGVVRDRVAGAARVSYARRSFGAWAGYELSRARLLGAAASTAAGGGGIEDTTLALWRAQANDSAGGPPPDDAIDAGQPRPSGTVGVWWQRRAAVLSLSVASGTERTGARAARYETRTFVDSIATDSGWVVWQRDSAVLVDPARAARARRIGDAEARVAWGIGRVVLDGAVGARLVGVAPSSRAAWGGVDATVAVGPHAMLVVGGGVRPTPLASRLLRERYASAGVRLSPARFFARPRLPVSVRASAAAFDVHPLGGGRYAVRVRVPGARVVELSGDFTGWQPVALTRVDADGWELVLPLSPGTHHLNIRVDGDAWVAPPGATTVADDFNGTVGVVVVP